MTREEIIEKDKIISNAEDILLKEFIGIDNVIHEVMRNVRMWYLFPETLERPMVINLFGLTGCGKTSLVRRLINLIGVENDTSFYNMNDTKTSRSWSLDIDDDERDRSKKNKVFVYDEFQHASTVNKDGEELFEKHEIPDLWDLIDSGLLHRKVDFRTMFRVDSFVNALDMLSTQCEVKLSNGVWENKNECLSKMSPENIKWISEFIDTQMEPVEENQRIEEGSSDNLVSFVERSMNMIEPFNFMKQYYINNVLSVACVINGKNDSDDMYKLVITKKMNEMDFPELLSFLKKMRSDARRGYTIDYSQSLVFVLGNIDEAYMMSFDVNPDMDPDSFKKLTEKLTIVDIKEALQKRFRNEQIARLGNTIIAYPSFSNDDFKKIIQSELDKYSSKVKSLYGYTIEFDKSINDMVFKDSVFPTHGTRPILSTIQETVKSKLPYAVKIAYENKSELGRVVYSYHNGYTTLECYDKENVGIGNESVKEVLRVDNHRNSDIDERQAIAAVHESGHFVMYVSLFGMLPEKLCSKSVSSETGGFLMHNSEEESDFVSMDGLKKRIAVALGGYVAEKTVFGRNMMSTGASEDLKKSTTMASKMIRELGFANPVVKTYLSDGFSTNGGMFLKDTDNSTMNINNRIDEIIRDAVKLCESTFSDDKWSEMLCESSQYLSEHTSMPKEVMKEIYDKTGCDKDGVTNKTFYRDCVKDIRKILKEDK